jgi:hypothetical protein
MSYIPDRKILELTSKIIEAREKFEQAVAERDKLRDDLAAARALLREAQDGHVWKGTKLYNRIDAALAGKDAK